MGDAYTFCPMIDDVPLSTHGTQASIRPLTPGINSITYEITHHLTLPEKLTDARTTRTGETTIEIMSLVTMQRDCPYLSVKTTFFNSAQDHKLSVIFPTDINAEIAHVDESFAVVDRQIDLPEAPGWVEDPTSLMHQRSFTDVSDGANGLAILNRGLAAVEVTREDAGIRISVPLVRSVGWLSRDDLWVRRIAAGPLVPTPGAQCLQERTCEYAIFPHAGDWQQVYQTAYSYTTPVYAARADTHSGINLHDMNITRDDPTKITHIPFPRDGHLPDAHSFFMVDGDGLVMTSLHRGETMTVIRFFNVKRKATTATITAGRTFESAFRLNLNEDVQQELNNTDGQSLELDVKPGEIVTIGFIFSALNADG